MADSRAGKQLITEKHTKLRDTGFVYSREDNFVVIWDSVTCGVNEGKPFTSARWKDKDEEGKWLDSSILFIQGIQERLLTYRRAIREQRGDNGKA